MEENVFTQNNNEANNIEGQNDISNTNLENVNAETVVTVKEKTEEEIRQEIYDRKKQVEEDLSSLKRRKEVKEEKYKSLEKAKDDIIDEKVKEAQVEISKTYDEMLYQADTKLKAVEEQKRREKSQLEKTRINKETKTFVEDNIQIHDVIKQKLREYSLPAYVNSGLFFSLFMPQTLSEFLGLIVTALIVLGILPIAIFLIICKKIDYTSYILLLLIYAGFIALFGWIYLTIHSKTIAKKKNEIIEIHEFRKDFIRNKKKIKRITENIKNDKDETNYDLQNVDNKIRKVKRELEDIQNKKLFALKQFEENVKLNIINEVEKASAKDISAARKELDEVCAEYENLEKELRSIQEKILEKYEIKTETENKEEIMQNELAEENIEVENKEDIKEE